MSIKTRQIFSLRIGFLVVTVLSSIVVCFLSSQNSLAYVSNISIYTPPQYLTMQPPAVGRSYTDPVFSTSVKRLSDSMHTTGPAGWLPVITPEYSTMSPFNSTNTYLLLCHFSFFALYDGAGNFLRNLPWEINAVSQPRWSRTDANVFYYLTGNQLKQYNVATNTSVVVRGFTEYSSISGNGESDVSFDGDHFVLAGNSRYIFVYEISTNTKSAVLDTAGRGFDSMYMTPNGNVTVTWLARGSSRYSGIELFDKNMKFLRQLTHAGGHMDVSRDVNGDEVLLWANGADAQLQVPCDAGVTKIRLSDGKQSCVWKGDWSLAIHVSAPDNSGWFFIETYAPSDPITSGWKLYTNEILQIKMDGSEVRRLVHHRSRPFNSYTYMPKASVSRDGTRLVYASNFGLQSILKYPKEYSDAYMINLAGTGSTTAPPTTSTGGSSTGATTGGSTTGPKPATGGPTTAPPTTSTGGSTAGASTGGTNSNTGSTSGATTGTTTPPPATGAGSGSNLTPSPTLPTVMTGGVSVTSAGGPTLQAGSAELNPSAGAQAPSGLAIFGFRQNGVLVSEAAIPASAPVLKGRIYTEIAGTTNTGFAVSNPNDSPATVSFFFTDANGQDSGNGTLTLPAHGQIARFLDQAPFNAPRPTNGTLSFSSNMPVSAIALRGLVNERSQFLVTTLPIVGTDAQAAARAVFPHLADGGGWRTQFVLINPTDQAVSGTLAFYDQGNSGAAAAPLALAVDGQNRSSINYAIPPRSSRRFSTSGASAQVRAGSARITPASGAAPDGVVIFSFKAAGVTVTEAGVSAAAPARAFRMYAEASTSGAVRTGVAIVNSSSGNARLHFELTRLDGTSAGLSGSLTIPTSAQRALFLQEIPGFQSLPMPFKGILRISSETPSDIAVVGLRGRVNERGDFLVTTTPPVDETARANSKVVFPHIVDGGGYTTQFVTFGGTNGEPPSGNLKLFSQAGGSLNLALR